MINIVLMLGMLVVGQELPNATTSKNKVVSETPHGNGCKTLYYSSGAVSLECGGNIVRANPVGTISCEKMPNLCPPAKGVVGIQQEKDKNGCTTWYDKDTGNEFIDCGSWGVMSPGIRDPEENGKLQVLRGVVCSGDCGTTTATWKESGTYAFHTPHILNVGEVLKVFNYSEDIESTCYVVANINKKTKFVKIDCKELYD